MGSRVPRCPMDCSPVTRRRRATTSWEVIPDGLSMMRSPFTLSTIVRVAQRLHFPGIEDVNPETDEIFHIACDYRKIVMDGRCCNHSIDDSQRRTTLFCGCSHATPFFGNHFRHRQDAACKPRAKIDIEPLLQRRTLLTWRKRADPLGDFPNRHDAEKDAVFGNILEECRHARVRLFAREFGRDIGVNEIPLHKSRSRPMSLSRSKSRFRPRSGVKSSTMSSDRKST